VALVLATRLTAAALGCSWSPFSPLAALEGRPAGVVAAAAALALLAALLWLAVRPAGDDLLRLAADGVTVTVAGEALAAALAGEAGGAHPDVVRVRLALGLRGATLRGRATVLARPLADAGAVRAAVAAALGAAATAALGRPLDELDVRVRVLRVRDLRRQLR